MWLHFGQRLEIFGLLIITISGHTAYLLACVCPIAFSLTLSRAALKSMKIKRSSSVRADWLFCFDDSSRSSSTGNVIIMLLWIVLISVTGIQHNATLYLSRARDYLKQQCFRLPLIFRYSQCDWVPTLRQFPIWLFWNIGPPFATFTNNI